MPKDKIKPVFTKALPKDDPTVAAGVLDLESLLAPDPSEVAFAEAQLAEAQRERNALKREAPTNFLMAHQVIIDALLMDPSQTFTALSKKTGYSRNWLSKVTSSDAFQAKLAERQKAICDPIIFASIKERLQGLATRTLDLIEERMDAGEVSLATALEVFGVVSKAQGLGTASKTPVLQQQFIVHVPPRMASATDWAAQHSGRPVSIVSEPLDITPDQESSQ